MRSSCPRGTRRSGLPRPWDQQWSLRIQQVLAFETDLLEYDDIFDGSKVIEKKTAELADAAEAELAWVLEGGGAFDMIDAMKGRLVQSHAERVRQIESGEHPVIGVNRFTEIGRLPARQRRRSRHILVVDEQAEQVQLDRLDRWRAERDADAVEALSAIGSYGRSLRDVPPSELGAIAARAAIARAGIEPYQVEHSVFGNVIHTDPEDMYAARVIAMKAGVPKESPALTVNRLCGSGAQAILTAAQMIRCDEASVALAGGAESMSRGPYWSTAARWGARMGPTPMVDPVVGVLTDPFHDIHMGSTAENLAREMWITRADQDAFAAESHRRAAAARDAGRFAAEIVPVEVPGRRGPTTFEVDEHIRVTSSLEALASCRPPSRRTAASPPATPRACTTAAARSPDRRGARAELGLKPLARVLAVAVAGVDPTLMGIGPVPAIRKALERAGRASTTST